MSEQERPIAPEERGAGGPKDNMDPPGKERRLRRILKAACWCFGAVTLGGLIVGALLLSRIGSAAAQEAEGVEVYTKAQIDRFITSVLITVQNQPLGGEAAPADMVFIASFNALEQRLTVAALARDMRIEMEDYGVLSLGEAYQAGGPGLLINGLNENFGLDLQSYVATDTHFLAAVVNILGGIEVELSEKEAAYIQSAQGAETAPPTGMALLDGGQSMIHAMDNVSGEERLGSLERSLELVYSAVANLRRTAVKEEMLPLLSLVLASVRTNLEMSGLHDLGYEILRADEIEYQELALPLPDAWEPAGEAEEYIDADLAANGEALREALYNVH